MRLWIKILLTVIIALTFLFSATYIFLAFRGKAIIIRQLKTLSHKEVSIGYFGITPLLKLDIKNLEIKDTLKVEAISITPSILGILTGKIALNEVKVIKAEFNYEKSPAETTELPAVSYPESAIAVKPKEKPPLPLIIKHINVKNGKIDFIDRTIGQEGIKITVKDINFNLTNLYIFPRSVITNFALKGRIPWKQGEEEGEIEAEGWLNLFKKDMQATLKIKDIDGIFFYPYYSKWVDLEKARIDKAKLNFIGNIHGINNDVTAECHLELTEIVFKPRPPEEQQEKAEKIAIAVLDIFKALNQGKIVLSFTIKTKMDRPEFGFGNIKMAFEDKLAKAVKKDKVDVEDILMLPSKFLQGTIKGATDVTTAVIEGAVAVGKEVTKAVTDPFKKEKKE